MANTKAQLDLFATPSPASGCRTPNAPSIASIDVTALNDGDLLDLLPDSGSRECVRLLGEIARRRCRAAIPALEAIALRHIGFGKERVVPEQAASLDALVSIGGVDAAEALSRLMRRQAFEGPCLKLAMEAAMRLDALLPQELVMDLLRHDTPEIRSAAAHCTRIWPKATQPLLELLHDLHDSVRIAAACALGRMGHDEARPILTQLLRLDPTEKVIEAVAGIWDEEVIVLLGRLAVRRPDLTGAILEALEAIDHPRAQTVAARMR